MGQAQGQDQDQSQDHLLLQRAALPQFLVLALALVLTLDLAQITKASSAKTPSVYSRTRSRHGFLQRLVTKRNDESTT